MIKLKREEEPQILVDNKINWTNNLIEAVTRYGSYKDIPKEEKNNLVSKYNHIEVKNALIKSSFSKCAFCESIPSESGNVEIEHYYPKSIYPNETFNWINFLPCCRKCNESKSNHDTKKEPIINPYDVEPNDVFIYELFNIKEKDSTLKNIAKKTIDVCSLNSQRLWKPRAEILLAIHQFSSDLHNLIEEFKEADTERKKTNKLKNIRETIDRIEDLMKPNERYSGFCKFYIENSSEYQEAKDLVSKY